MGDTHRHTNPAQDPNIPQPISIPRWHQELIHRLQPTFAAVVYAFRHVPQKEVEHRDLVAGGAENVVLYRWCWTAGGAVVYGEL